MSWLLFTHKEVYTLVYLLYIGKFVALPLPSPRGGGGLRNISQCHVRGKITEKGMRKGEKCERARKREKR
jgi:hypothetical protein